MDSFIFSGMGHASGKYPITNDFIGDSIQKGFLKGFDEARMAKSSSYQAYLEEHPGIRPFDYFVREKMGFGVRHHVAPFPPTRKKLYYAESSLELGVKATEAALAHAGLSGDDIGAWFFSTVSPQQKAPGIGSFIKAHFTKFDNKTPAFTITSGCGGFNTNLERALEYLQIHPDCHHVVVGHTETMSSFLTQRVKFVPFVTFADAAGVVILSRVQTEEKVGVIAIVNHQDLKMVDFVGVDINWNLYMDDAIIKDRAIENINEAALEVLSKAGWNSSDVDLLVPHQTGNAILLPAAGALGISTDKVVLDAQMEYGNVSGATVPVAYSMLSQQQRFTPGTRILSPMAGVGGDCGAFVYLVPEKEIIAKPGQNSKPLVNKTAMVLGASGVLGSALVKHLADLGANLILQFNKNNESCETLCQYAQAQGVTVKSFKVDFYQKEEVDRFIAQLKLEQSPINYFVNTAGVLLSRHDGKVLDVNLFAPLQIFKTIFPILKGTALFMGAAAEDINVPEIHEFISAKRALHGNLASMSGEVYKSGNHLVWYIPGVLGKGMLRNIDPKALYQFMIELGQEEYLDVEQTAKRVVNSLYIPKVCGTYQTYENAMVVRRDGYKPEVDI